jgi:phenylacetate-CoA ligase
MDGVAVQSSVAGLAWPGLPGASGAAMLALQFQLERSQWWPAERLVEYQFKQLRALAAHAAENVPFYREHLSKCGLASAGDLTPESYLRWPVLRRRDLQERPQDLLAARYPSSHGPASEMFTSGSTGTPMRVTFSNAAQFFAVAMALRDHIWHERQLSQKLCAIRWLAPEARQAGWGPATNAAFVTGPSAAMDVSADVDSQLDWLIREQPAYLVTTPSNLRALLERSAAQRRRPQTLKAVMTYSEALPEDLREALRRGWQALLADTYSCTEFGALALQCPVKPHYHVQSENVLLEILREDGTPCEPGEIGRVVVTGLHNFAMPLLRYELGDMAQAGGQCSCGRGLPVLTGIAGRVRNMARDPRGRLFQPAFDPAIEQAGIPLRQYQFVQVAAAALELAYVMDREMSEDERTRLKEAVSGQMGYPVSLAVRRVDAIPRAPGGKFEGFVSRIAENAQ